MITMLKGKIHRATVTQAELNYVGSITIDETLMNAAGFLEYEKVQIADVNNGKRFETYVIAGQKDSGIICLNGAAAHMVQVGDEIIIMAYRLMTESNAKTYQPKVVLVDEQNQITKLTHYEKHGQFASEA
ncbi:MAG: aspartate 1-decarboxylase [Streptococcaceae bacterium]|jgi:aspartate 1-decarboxylase|nr:aspartate 1-decarboxylase [Streptococcaceae bacterium]